jgi:hypothetical protein
MISAERLRELLAYDPETGVFTWRVGNRRNVVPGQRAGCPDTGGYLLIRVAGRLVAAHRLAWLYVHGEWPSEQVDHINSVKTDNRICNLRLATRAQNMRNMGLRRSNTSGFKGAWKHGKRWKSVIMVDRRRIHLGCFDTPEEAHAAYCDAAEKYHGVFARKG